MSRAEEREARPEHVEQRAPKDKSHVSWSRSRETTAIPRQTPDIRHPTRDMTRDSPHTSRAAGARTGVVSYLTARLSRSILIARRQRLTRVWWHRYRDQHPCCISDLVLAEARAGDVEAADERLQALSGIAALRLNPNSRSLAKQLIGGGLLPTSAVSDAEHIAVAATNSVRLLLTWNCKHLANPAIRDAVVLTCETNGARCPEICTPEQLMRTYEYERPTS